MYMCNEFMFGEDATATAKDVTVIIKHGLEEAEKNLLDKINEQDLNTPKYWYYLGYKDCTHAVINFLDEINKEVL